MSDDFASVLLRAASALRKEAVWSSHRPYSFYRTYNQEEGKVAKTYQSSRIWNVSQNVPLVSIASHLTRSETSELLFFPFSHAGRVINADVTTESESLDGTSTAPYQDESFLNPQLSSLFF